MSSKRFIELYSGNRNRVQYPEPAQFEVPFSPTMQTNGKNAVDPVVNGGVYYKFRLNINRDLYVTYGTFLPGSTKSNPIISEPIYGEFPPSIVDYYIGWDIVDENVNEVRDAFGTITGYNPSTSTLTLLRPFKNDPTGHNYGLYIRAPYSSGSINIPAVDVNFNSIFNYELAYNGYYLVFESSNPSYSNAQNSNIFYRKIKYYDNGLRIAYFDPLPDDYLAGEFDIFTLRQQVPEERWSIETPSFVNTVPSDQPIVGPLVGPIITLPPTASSVDNYYVGKFVYYYSNGGYTPEELPTPNQTFAGTATPMPGVFYPIYGCYYIKAYNGATKQLSVDYDVNNTPLPSYIADIGYNSGSFRPYYTEDIVVTQIDDNTYQAVVTTGKNTQFTSLEITPIEPSLYTYGKTYRIVWRIKAQQYTGDPDSPPYIDIQSYVGTSIGYTKLAVDSDEYITYEFSVIPLGDIQFAIYPGKNGGDTYTIEWDLFVMSETPIINISSFKCDNFTPLSYNGSMVSINEAVCYEVDLISLTLPNASLLTGSRISFYPYVYVEFANATSPNGASRELIYSNNPHSKNALFIAATPNQVAPLLSTFITLSGSGMSQVVKFKPNDNLRFSVYLPDGTLFQTLETDFFSPYLPSLRAQIDALFSIRRI